MRALTFFALLLLAALPATAAGPAPDWSFDLAHGSVNFTAKHILSFVPGRFDRFGGTFRFDPANLEGSKIDMRIETASVSTHVEKRDEHLRSSEFFDAARFPAITFQSERILAKGGGAFVAKGTLTIKDVRREVELPFTFLGEKPSPMEKDKRIAGFVSRFSVNLIEHQVMEPKWRDMGVIGESADITVYLELFRAK